MGRMLRSLLFCVVIGGCISFLTGCGGGGGGSGGANGDTNEVLVTIDPLAPGTKSGTILFTLELASKKTTSDASYVAHYSLNGGLNFSQCTVGVGGDPMQGLRADFDTEQYTFAWDTLADGIGWTTTNLNVILRLTTMTGYVDTITLDIANLIDVVLITNTAPTYAGTQININFTMEFVNSTSSANTSISFRWLDGATPTAMTATGGGTLNGVPVTIGATGSPQAVSVDWDAIADLAAVNGLLAIPIRIVASVPNSPTFTLGTFNIDNQVTVDVDNADLVGPVSGAAVNVDFTLFLANGTATSAIDVNVQYSTNSALGPWTNATAAAGSTALTNLTANPGGTTATFIWDTTADVGFVNDMTVFFRVVVLLNSEEEVVGPFEVDNDNLTQVANLTINGPSWTNVNITFDLLRPMGGNTDITVEYSFDGATYFTCTPNTDEATHEGDTNLSTSVGGDPHVFIWDTWADDLMVNTQQVAIRVTPTDSALASIAVNTLANLNDAPTNPLDSNNNAGFRSVARIDDNDVIHLVYSIIATAAVGANDQCDLKYRNSGADGVFGTPDDSPIIDLTTTSDIYVQSFNFDVWEDGSRLGLVCVQNGATNDLLYIDYDPVNSVINDSGVLDNDITFTDTDDFGRRTCGIFIEKGTGVHRVHVTYPFEVAMNNVDLLCINSGGSEDFLDGDEQSATLDATGGNISAIAAAVGTTDQFHCVFTAGMDVLYVRVKYSNVDGSGIASSDLDTLEAGAVTSSKPCNIHIGGDGFIHAVLVDDSGNLQYYKSDAPDSMLVAGDKERVSASDNNVANAQPMIMTDGYENAVIVSIDQSGAVGNTPVYVFYQGDDEVFNSDAVNVAGPNSTSNVAALMRKTEPAVGAALFKSRIHIFRNDGSALEYNSSANIP